ncbi:glycine zipper 2TM domain-containing protein [Paraburkholderia dinghuensis]|uniref:Glycine zipper 2TM domain-containing protein n=2 Tax=Paraburkholderia dinghuensis TaxID=2305225 RepID=A0A3N6N8J2_9BURK|nr:glycine zipper 2TM domain-containing protein [Paraburkholderia dinghuensis]RQH05312.1 glycine zipper 2TM domain-containing protein [Paraburkholderia dinghuensis]
MKWLKRSGAALMLAIVAASATGACTLGGAAAGGYVGNKATNGSGVGTVGGAVAGGVIGYELGK